MLGIFCICDCCDATKNLNLAEESLPGCCLAALQVVLSMQLSFAVFPLVHFTSLKRFTGRYANSLATSIAAVLVALLIAGLNGYLLVSVLRDPGSLTVHA
jgi:Mn2+/Fe2+ NRAMP family transporter